MKKIINVPNTVRYISQWADFESKLPQKKPFIFNKVVCDCGASHYFLTNKTPLVLCSPRKELLHSKYKQIQDTHLFRPDGNYKLDELKLKLDAYLILMCSEGKTPKILVTFDSFKYVLEVLNNRKDTGRYTILVDEFHCLYTDSAIKADVEIGFIELLKPLTCLSIIFLSATPYLEKYLSFDSYFKGLDYVELQWDASKFRSVNLIKQKMKSVKSTMKNIVTEYRKNGWFAKKSVLGKEVVSNEAVIFLNNVGDIITVVKDNNLKQSEYDIICSETSERRLMKEKMKRSHIPVNKSDNKPFTFVTKASFEGADFYSDSAITIIFANPQIECLSLDISLDIPQILGRQRNEDNPFRNDCWFYYKTIPSFSPEEKNNFNSMIQKKEDETTSILGSLQGLPEEALLMLKDGQSKANYSKNYVSIITDSTGKLKAVKNDLVMLSEKRGWEIQSSQYTSAPQIFREKCGYTTLDKDIELFLEELGNNNNEQEHLKKYCEFCDSNPTKKEQVDYLPQIDSWIKDAFKLLGHSKCRALSYRKKDVVDETLKCVLRSSTDIRVLIKASFTDQEYSGEDARTKLQEIYDRLKIGTKAKATDLSSYGWKEVRKHAGRFWRKI